MEVEATTLYDDGDCCARQPLVAMALFFVNFTKSTAIAAAY